MRLQHQSHAVNRGFPLHPSPKNPRRRELFGLKLFNALGDEIKLNFSYGMQSICRNLFYVKPIEMKNNSSPSNLCHAPIVFL